MNVIVLVTERHSHTRQLIGHDLSGKYKITLPDDLLPPAIEKQAIAACTEQLSITDDQLFTLTVLWEESDRVA